MTPQEREAFEAMREALQQFYDIYPEKVRAHPDVRIACEAARAALALADKVRQCAPTSCYSRTPQDRTR